MTPEIFLKTEGIEVKNTVFATFIDGVVRSPDLCKLMQDYALKYKENCDKISMCTHTYETRLTFGLRAINVCTQCGYREFKVKS